MKRMVKELIKYIIFGISWGCTWLVFQCLFSFIFGGQEALYPVMENFAGNALGAMAVGVACGSTAIVYQVERLSRSTKLLIHFLVGMGVYYPVAIRLGWIPFYPEKFLYTVVQFLFSCGIFFAIRFCFYLFYRSEAKKINDRLQQLERDDFS